jgi:hypothetical protein
MAKVRARRAWAIVCSHNIIHLDKIMASRGEAWGMLSDAFLPSMSVRALKALGYRCIRVTIKPVT